MPDILEERERTAMIPSLRSSIQDESIELGPVVFDPAERWADADSVTVGIASFPSRRENLRHCVDSLYRQADRICVYLNGYEELPEFLKRENVSVSRSSRWRGRR